MDEKNLRMEDFQTEIDASFRDIREGDLLTGIVIGVSETGITVDLGYYTDGFVPANEVSNNPHFAIRTMSVGTEVTGMVLKSADDNGYITMSLKRAADLVAWDYLKDLMEQKTVIQVKIADVVNAGVITFVEDIRGFIPLSLLSTEHIDDASSYVGKELSVIVTTVDASHKKLILSAKAVEYAQKSQEKHAKISRLQKGTIIKGIVEKTMPYGAFVSIGNGLSGLVHISQICAKRIKSPNEVLKLGDEVTVKIIDIKDEKISLSMTAVKEEETQETVEDASEVPFSYSTGEEATTGLGELLKIIQL